jgi:hypothetical protein
MGRQWNTIIESLGPLSGGTMSINANLTEIEALLTTLQADVADGITVSGALSTVGTISQVNTVNSLGTMAVLSSGTVMANGGDFTSQDTSIPLSKIQVGFENTGGDFVSVDVNTNPFPISGTVTANPATSTSGGTGATTATSTTFATALASNTSRKGATIFNEGTGIMYLTIGTATTSTSQYTTRLSGGDYYELPYNYTGQIGYIFGSAGTARVTEIV